MSTDRQIHLLDDLQSLLEKQIELVRRSDFQSSEALTSQADSIVDELVRTKAFEQTKFKEQQERLAKIFKKLILMVTAQKDRIGGQMRRISKARKTLRAYRYNG